MTTNIETFDRLGFWHLEHYPGLIGDAPDHVPETGEDVITTIYGHRGPFKLSFNRGGSVYGFMTGGRATLSVDGRRRELHVLDYFAAPSGAILEAHDIDTTVFLAERSGYKALHHVGGPVEEKGRLRYIDGCSDTLLIPPAKIGDPSLNYLHFPTGIDQTFHTHPTLRAGVISSGNGWCELEDRTVPLRQGMIFWMTAGTVHRFFTSDEHMDVIAFHPDTDWGPTDTEHPMLNRTWVDGKKIDNSTAQHEAEVVTGR